MDSYTSLLRRYRSDRRKLTEFLFSSGVVRQVKTAIGLTASDFDSISSDYVLDCIRSGEVLDVSQAMQRYFNDSSLPLLVGDAFYLQTDSDSAGSPPHRVSPSLPLEKGVPFESFNTEGQGQYYRATGRSPMCNGRDRVNNVEAKVACLDSPNHNNIPSLALPSLRTGLLDDDLRESAYEVFISCVLLSRPEVHPTESRKMEKSSKFMSLLKNRREKRCGESEFREAPWSLLHVIRTQMQISESADAFIRRSLVLLISDKYFEQIDIPKLSLALITRVMGSDFPGEKQYLRWRNRQANVLEELLSSGNQKSERKTLRAALAKIRNLQEWEFKMSTYEKNDVLLSIDELASAISSIPGRFGLAGETRYWTSCYHLNIRLYERLLFGLFDILEDCQLIHEADEVLKLLKLTWPTLGITERLHHALFSWVLFQQFHATKEPKFLEYAAQEVGRVLSIDICSTNEVAYLRSLVCFGVGVANEIRSNVIQSIFLSISSWCDSKLEDYHLHFDQKASFFGSVLKLGLHTGTCDFVSPGDNQFARFCVRNMVASEKIRTYSKSSINAARRRIIGHATNVHMRYDAHHLADLANQLQLIAEKEHSLFSPVLRYWYPECAMITAKTLHELFGERLRPFLEDVTCRSEDIKKALPSAYSLECCLMELYSSSQENNSHSREHINFYPIAEVSKPIVLDWVVGQHERILEWTGRTFDLEDWEPLSVQQRQAASAIEVFRIIEETVDQFFAWTLPMDVTHLQALLSIIFHTLDAYLSKVANQLVEKHNLYPCTPPLTRYKEAKFPVVNKKLAENFMMDDAIYKKLDDLTVSKLCIRLNTYQYIQKQIVLLEDSIRNFWQVITSRRMLRYSMENPTTNSESTDLNSESVSELFVATLDCIKNSVADAVRRTSEFLGAKIVFWDMRDSFLLHLYHVSVDRNRLEEVLPQFDSVLNIVCGLIDDAIRDTVVMNIWKASKEGFMWVLLDGGPTRTFSESDISLIEQDFKMLMDLFIADGEGLPRRIVEEDAKSYHKILHLFSQQTESLIQMLIDSSHNISVGAGSIKDNPCYSVDSHTFLRILCHKKDKKASTFLKRHYNLPPSSEYYDIGLETRSFSSPIIADMIRNASSRWSEKGQNSFRSLTMKLRETTWK